MKRGAFIVLEGLDHSGKTTQCKCLVERLTKEGYKVESMRFPDRTTPIGKLIDTHLKSDVELSDEAIHLLFSANRWELHKIIMDKLSEGITIICDRYAYSGWAYGAAKGL